MNIKNPLLQDQAGGSMIRQRKKTHKAGLPKLQPTSWGNSGANSAPAPPLGFCSQGVAVTSGKAVLCKCYARLSADCAPGLKASSLLIGEGTSLCLPHLPGLLSLIICQAAPACRPLPLGNFCSDRWAISAHKFQQLSQFVIMVVCAII